ncbi:MAG: FHA domain-containing protein [Anaerolineae bacterium]
MLDLISLQYIALGALSVLAILLIVVLIRRRHRAPAPPPRAAPESIAFLERTSEGDGPRIFALNKPVITVGRAEGSDVRVEADLPGALTISRRHAQIRCEDAEFILEDLGSQNGIKVNGLVTHRNLLRDGYRVSFGSVEFVFRGSEPGDAARSDT